LTDDFGDGDDGTEEGVLEDAPLESEEEVCVGEKTQFFAPLFRQEIMPDVPSRERERRVAAKEETVRTRLARSIPDAPERKRDLVLLLALEDLLLRVRRLADILEEERQECHEDERLVGDDGDGVVGIGAEVAVGEE
jgi:hypothetical protein